MDGIVRAKLHPESQAVFRYVLEHAPETFQYPFGSVVVKPLRVAFSMAPAEKGVWWISTLWVSGHEIVQGKVEEREYFIDLPFVDPLDTPDKLPEWLREIARYHVNLMNRDEALRERQDEAARKAAREMFAGLMPGDTGKNMADEIAEKLLTAVRRVG
jgi:hypothetical protein